jgi:hypothetical protein
MSNLIAAIRAIEVNNKKYMLIKTMLARLFLSL